MVCVVDRLVFVRLKFTTCVVCFSPNQNALNAYRFDCRLTSFPVSAVEWLVKRWPTDRLKSIEMTNLFPICALWVVMVRLLVESRLYYHHVQGCVMHLSNGVSRNYDLLVEDSVLASNERLTVVSPLLSWRMELLISQIFHMNHTTSWM